MRPTCQSGRMDSNIGRSDLRQPSSSMISKCQTVGARSSRGLSEGGSDKLTGCPWRLGQGEVFLRLVLIGIARVKRPSEPTSRTNSTLGSFRWPACSPLCW